jgi:hypothetical protein
MRAPNNKAALICAAVLLLILPFFLFSFRKPDQVRGETRNRRLMAVAVALRDYQYTHGRLPPSYTTDSLGRPMHSWRTLLLPFLGQEELAKSVDFNRPWNDAVNLPKLRKALSCFQSGASDNSLDTDFVVLEGVGLAFHSSHPVSVNPSALCAIVFEIPKSGIPWYEPRDIQVPVEGQLGIVRDLVEANGELRFAAGLKEPEVITVHMKSSDEEILRLLNCASERGKVPGADVFARRKQEN